MIAKLKAWGSRLFPVRSRRRNQRRWQERWNAPDYDPPWMNRGVSEEIKVAVKDGWFKLGGVALDLGCGEGEVAHWLAQQGFHAIGIDLAAAAITRAKSKYPETPGKLEFQAHDLCADPLPFRNVNCFIDRGCFHQIPPGNVDAYVQNILAAAAPDARLLMFIRAFRGNTGLSQADEQAEILEKVKRAFNPQFDVARIAETNLGGIAPDGSRNHLPGLAFWLTRKKVSG